jgi:hypothetical protein
LAASQEASGAHTELVDFDEALVLVGRKPRIDSREDLIFQADTIAGRWQWSTYVGKGINEAIALHKKAGDAFMIVSDEDDSASSSWKRSLGGSRGASPSVGPDSSPAIPNPRSSEQPGEPHIESYIDRLVDDAKANQAAMNEQEGQQSKWESKTSQGMQFGNPGGNGATTTTAIVPRPRVTQRKRSWLDDYTTASLALCSVLMIGPDIVSLLIAFDTFLPIVFITTQLGFIAGTVAAYASRDEGDRHGRDSQ